jgi:hypothetical protein
MASYILPTTPTLAATGQAIRDEGPLTVDSGRSGTEDDR